MKNGRLYDAATLDEVWPRQRALPPLWFRNEAPAVTIPATLSDASREIMR
jgi:hypothetical protein